MITGENHIGNQRSATGAKTYKTFNPKLNIENKIGRASCRERV